MQLAREQLASVRVIAPVDGVVSTRTVNVGETIGAGSPLMTVVALHGVYFEAQVPERSMAAVRPGMSVRVTVDSLPGKTFRGVVREMIPVATPGSKNFRVRIGLADTEQLPVGAFARGEIDLGRYPRTLVVPKESLLSLAGENYVSPSITARAPAAGETRCQRRTHTGSFRPQEGDRIVVGGVDTLSDGTRVQIVTGNNKQS